MHTDSAVVMLFYIKKLSIIKVSILHTKSIAQDGSWDRYYGIETRLWAG
jgi:hypothetical protein